jgi:hypothetical protein
MPAEPAQPIITLLTDFGTTDWYVAAMKAVLLRHCPAARLIDVTHDIPPGDILRASITLERISSIFPPGTVHLAVVDPGVGTARRPLLARVAGQLLVCPDNGLLTWPHHRLGGSTVMQITWRPDTPLSRTFHGRDLFAPVAALLAGGTPPDQLARPISDPALLDIAPAPSPAQTARIIHIDRFGNATTNVPASALPANPVIRLPHLELRLTGAYADVPTGHPLALIGSSDLLEIAIRDGSAAQVLGLRVGDSFPIR